MARKLVLAVLIATGAFVVAGAAQGPAGENPSSTEPVGIATTDPESSSGDASESSSWILWLALGAGVVVVGLYVVRSRRGASSPEA